MNVSRMQEQAEWWYELHNPSYDEWRAYIEGQANAMILGDYISLYEMTLYTADMLDLFDQLEEQC